MTINIYIYKYVSHSKVPKNHHFLNGARSVDATSTRFGSFVTFVEKPSDVSHIYFKRYGVAPCQGAFSSVFGFHQNHKYQNSHERGMFT